MAESIKDTSVLREYAVQAVKAALALGCEDVDRVIEVENVLVAVQKRDSLMERNRLSHHAVNPDVSLLIDPDAFEILREAAEGYVHDVDCAFGRVVDVRDEVA